MHKLLLSITLFILFATPISAQILLNERNGSIWTEQAHPIMQYISVEAGAGYFIRPKAGFSKLEGGDEGLVMGKFAIHASRAVPLLSRITWQGTLNSNLTEKPLRKENLSPATMKGLVEIRLPFTMSVLSHDTSFYLQYKRSSYRFGADVIDNITYGNGTFFQDGEPLTIGSTTQYFAIAISTPITEENSIDSYSRFGIYTQFTDHSRAVSVMPSSIDLTANSLILDIDERQVGLFYDIKKPVFIEGLIIHIYLAGGYGWQNIGSNVYRLQNKDFEASNALLCVNTEVDLSYRYHFTDNFGVRIGLNYAYEYLDTLKSRSDEAASLNNAGIHIGGIDTSLTYTW
ncbi:MAG: hypothetical protein LBV09_02320 [Deferribacteraceae bacterium]|jgi:hypothetical protein|nr:hypothetical protein [Deferribacteraceae bacterium]